MKKLLSHLLFVFSIGIPLAAVSEELPAEVDEELPAECWLELLVPSKALGAAYSYVFWVFVTGEIDHSVSKMLKVIEDPTTGKVYLHLPSRTWEVAEDGDPMPIVLLLGSAAPQEVKDLLYASLVQHRGSNVSVQEMLPEMFLSYCRTREELEFLSSNMDEQNSQDIL